MIVQRERHPRANMNVPFPRKLPSGITLVELLAVIVVLAVLIAILIPTISGVVNQKGNFSHASHARQIAQAYQTYSLDQPHPRNISTTASSPGGTALTGTASNIEDVALILAKYAKLNDGAAWFIRTDKNLADAYIPRAVFAGDITQAKSVTVDFQKTSPKAWAFVVGLTTSPPQASMMPLLWTYGLKSDGTWLRNSPWDGTGGHIAYLDGHVEWAERISLENGGVSFAVYSGGDQGKPTVDYRQAINSHAENPCQVVNADGRGN